MSQYREPLQNSFPVKEVLTLIGVVITAYIGYIGTRSQTELLLRATQTAEARLTLSAPQLGENENTEVSKKSTLTFTPTNMLPVDTPILTATPTFTLTNTLVPTATPVIIIHSSGGNITYGTGNQWRFSTEISPLKINIELDQPPNSCKIAVTIWDRDAKQTFFEEILLSTQRSYLAHVNIVPYGNYTLIVSVPVVDQYSNCSESEKYTYEITLSDP